METDANVALTSWWGLTVTDPEFMKTWRESQIPGGCAHSGEAETSLALHLDSGVIQMDKSHLGTFGLWQRRQLLQGLQNGRVGHVLQRTAN